MLRYVGLNHILMSFLFVMAMSISKTGAEWFVALDFSVPFILLFLWALFSDNIGFPIVPFALGFMQDALAGTPFGFWSMVFMSFYVLCLMQVSVLRTAGIGALWVSFVLLSGITFVAVLGVVGVFESIQLSLGAMIEMVLTAWVAFPVLAIPLYQYFSADDTDHF